ncbi:hypothetical protein G9A89_007021 [Geosiphon pyriformis]|nr:hypothetical protein G9A89_007021 [Geosiphon pyriformis]
MSPSGIFSHVSSLTELIGVCSLDLIWGITQNAETLEYGMVMYFDEHGDMRRYLSANFHSTSWSDKLEILFRIAQGLDSIHSSGMVHRDLHSGNIIQYYYDGISIGDQGLCQPTNNEATTTEEKKIYGVILYILPEVLRGENFTSASPLIPPSIAELIEKCWYVNAESCPTAGEVDAVLERLYNKLLNNDNNAHSSRSLNKKCDEITNPRQRQPQQQIV